jgi:signal transduction histidine kinase
VERAKSWTELIEQLYEGAWSADLQRFRSPYAFRGLDCGSHDLSTSLQRLAGARGDAAPLEQSLLRNFRKYAHARAANGVDSIWHWLALAQHHGLPTRLIDWTYSPFVALHFATAYPATYGHDGIVWCVNFVRAHELLPKELRRLLERDPAAGKQRLADVQEQLERDELEMRSFVTRLRPARGPVASPAMSLVQRLEELSQRIERQWDIHVKLHIDSTAGLTEEILEGTYRLAQESIVNAARHADASVIDVRMIRRADDLELRISDDGRGFAFQGTYDLKALDAMDDGPLTLKERVADLGGTLRLTSADTGTELLITLPLARASV